MSAPLSPLGLGCSRLGSFNNLASAADQRAALIAALNAGVTVFDTANIYGQGDSERIIGRTFGRQRDNVFVITKLGKLFSTKMRLMRPLKPILKPLLAAAGRGSAVTAARQGNMAADFSPTRYASALDASLRRLGFDHVDALLLHSPDAAAIGASGVGPALQALVTSGRARMFGISVDDRGALDAALAVTGIGMVQVPLDVADAAAAELADARARGVKVALREVIRLQPDLSPPEAARAAVGRPFADCVIVGASSPSRIRELASALD
jgi:aryl-alcohol dehydrogenase-like predicted oxidoreductase